jgi:small subunit ribosomal protein S8
MQEMLQGGRKRGRIREILVILMVDVFADAINKIKVYENNGFDECEVSSTKLIRAVLEKMKDNNYINGFEEVKDGRFSKLKVSLSKKINDMGVIKPRYAIKLDEFQKYETRFIPSKDFGVLILSTPKGILTNREAKQNKTGGRLIAYVY